MDNTNLSLPSQVKAPEKRASLGGGNDQRTFLVGILLLLIVVCLWTGSSFLTQGLFSDGYEKPFLLTYLSTSAFSLYLVPFAYRTWRERTPVEIDTTRGQYEALPTDASSLVSAPLRSRSIPRGVHDIPPQALPPLTTGETAKLASIFCFFWFIANWSVNASLDYTSVASSTILSSMSGFFTLLIGRVFNVEAFTLGKLGAVVTSFLGVLLVSLADSMKDTTATNPGDGRNFLLSFRLGVSDSVDGSPATSNPALGDALALTSALFYALYVTLLKVRIHTESRIDMQLFFGFVGLFNLLTLWPLGLLLHVTGVEKAEWPNSKEAWIMIGINMLITFSSDYIYLLAMLKTTPLLVTIGLSLTIPFAVLGDFFWLGIEFKVQRLLGAALVLLSFVAVGLEGSKEVEEQDPLSSRGSIGDEEHDEVGEISGEVYGSTGRSRGRSFTRRRTSSEWDDEVFIGLRSGISRDAPHSRPNSELLSAHDLVSLNPHSPGERP